MSSLESKITGMYYWIDHTTVVLVKLATQNKRCQVKSVVNAAKYKASVVVILSEAGFVVIQWLDHFQLICWLQILLRQVSLVARLLI